MKGKLDLPGGFVDMGESIEEALHREIAEELGLNPNDYSTPHYITSYISGYPWGNENYQNLIFVFAAYYNDKTEIKPQDDVADVRWSRFEEIDTAELALPAMLRIAKQSWDILKTKGETSNA